MHSFRIRLFCVNKSVPAEEAHESAVSFPVCRKEQLHCGLCVRSFHKDRWKHAQVHGRSSPAASGKKKKGSCSDNPGVFFHSCPGFWSCRDQTLLSLCPYFPPLTKGTFSAKHPPPPPTLPATNANHLVVGKMTLTKPTEARAGTQGSPLPLLTSCQHDGVPWRSAVQLFWKTHNRWRARRRGRTCQ